MVSGNGADRGSHRERGAATALLEALVHTETEMVDVPATSRIGDATNALAAGDVDISGLQLPESWKSA